MLVNFEKFFFFLSNLVVKHILPSATFSKPCSGYKMKEITGSGIFSANAEDSTAEAGSANSNNRTSIRIYQVYYLDSFLGLGFNLRPYGHFQISNQTPL